MALDIFMENFVLSVTVLPPVLEGAVIVTLFGLDASAAELLPVILITSLPVLDDKVPMVNSSYGRDEVTVNILKPKTAFEGLKLIPILFTLPGYV